MSNDSTIKVHPDKSPKHRRGIYLLPNLFTIGALFAGFYAIIKGTQGHFTLAAIAIFVAMLLDTLDGRVARLTHSQSEFGAQLDSLSDMVCFGVTPALVMYSWVLSSIGRPGWLAAFIYMMCTALRLARFNSQAENTNKRYFRGLATTAAAGFIGGLIWVGSVYHLQGRGVAIFVAVIAVLVGLLKVSTVKYRSFKDIDVRGKVPFLVIIAAMLIFVLISYDTSDILFAIFTLYMLSGPVMWLWKRCFAWRRSSDAKH